LLSWAIESTMISFTFFMIMNSCISFSLEWGPWWLIIITVLTAQSLMTPTQCER
jgi:uncharacterized membrane protein